ncbi:MAG: hypothetical protein RLZZ44_214 [Bacteroidota bacterium]
MKILVTGGAGFIGSHLIQCLLSEGHKVQVLDNLSTGNVKNLHNLNNKALQIHNGSVLDYELCENLISKTDYIFHLAAAVGVFTIVNKPLESMITNIRGTENILDLANKYGKQILITSSSEIYGKNSIDKLSENSDRILGPTSFLRWSYAESKAIDESLAFAYFQEFNLPVRIVRFFNTVGPRQVGQHGMVVPRFIEAALNDLPIEIYGDGTQTRCFAHIDDVVEALIGVAFSNNTLGKVVNIGNDEEISILDLAKKVIQVSNSNSKILFKSYDDAYGRNFEDMVRRVPDLNLIRSLIGWAPKKSITDIIQDIINYRNLDL